MPNWTFDGDANNTPYLCAYVYGETSGWTMAFSNDGAAAINYACLFVEEEYQGMVGVRLSADEDYRPVMSFPDAAGYIGTLPVGSTEIQLCFLNVTEPDRTFFVVPVQMTVDDMISEPTRAWGIDYGPGPWAQCYAKQVFWRQGYFDTVPDCEDGTTSGAGFSDTWEPSLWEDSFTPALWVA